MKRFAPVLILFLLLASSCRNDYREPFVLAKPIELTRSVIVPGGRIEDVYTQFQYIDIIDNLIAPDLAETEYRTYTEFQVTGLKVTGAFVETTIETIEEEKLDELIFYLNGERIFVASATPGNGGYGPLFDYSAFEEVDLLPSLGNPFNTFESAFRLTLNNAPVYSSRYRVRLILEYEVEGTYWTEK